MAKRPATATTNDLAEVVAFLKQRRVITEPAQPGVIEVARHIHQAAYSLILWRFRLRGLREHGRVFIDEIASDALQILPQALMGYGKTTKLLTRGIIENTLRHIYFSDHPVEFARMNRDAKWFLTTEDLFVYISNHHAFFEPERRFAAVNKLKTLYSELSAGIHGRSVEDLEMRRALQKIAYSEVDARRESEFIRRCAESANFLLAVFHRDKVRRFQQEDRRIILKTLSIKARQAWSDTHAL